MIDINSWECLKSPIFFFVAMSSFDWPIAKTNSNNGGSPKIEDSVERWSASPFGRTI